MAIVINGTGSISGLSNVGGISSAQSGSVIQVVTSSAQTSTTTTSSSSFVSTGITKSITPQFATSKILVIANTSIDSNANGNQGIWTIYRNGSTNIVDGNSTGNGFGGVYGTSSRLQVAVSGIVLDSPATTSSTTYTIYGRSGTGTIDFNPTCDAFITLMEIAA